MRLRSNESPSGAFEQQNGLAQARWRGLAPTSSDFVQLCWDWIVRYCLEHKIYNINQVNTLLFEYDQEQLGA